MISGRASRICCLGREGTVGVTAKDNWLFVKAVLYRYRAGIPWRDLPERFGDFRVVHTRFSRWAKRGVWARVFEHFAQDADNEYAMIDATIVRARRHTLRQNRLELSRRHPPRRRRRLVQLMTGPNVYRQSVTVTGNGRGLLSVH